MNSGFCIIRVGVLEHLIARRLGIFELGLYVIVHLQADFKTGIWWGSAAKLHASAPAGISLREVQRGLQRLSAFILTLRARTINGLRRSWGRFWTQMDLKKKKAEISQAANSGFIN